MNRSLLILLLSPLSAFADPLSCIPKAAGVVIKIETPRALVEGAVQFDAFKQLQAFPQVKESLDSVKVRRFLQLVKFIETTTGSVWPDLIDQVAGNGIALGFKLNDDDPPTVAVIEGKDAATVAKVFALFVAGVHDEATRNTALKVTDGSFHDVPTLAVGDNFFAARDGVRIILADKRIALEASLMLALKLDDNAESVLSHATVAPARALIGPGAAAWLWFDLAAAKVTQAGKDFFANARKELVQLLLFGSTLDAAGRSGFLAAGLYATPQGYTLSIRLPAKRAALDPVMKLHVPPSGPGSKPLLEPPGTVLSQSFYLDLGYLWSQRATVIADDTVRKDFEKTAADISKATPNTSFGEILQQLGPHHRLVVVQTGERLYHREPGQPIPPTAYVASIRDASLSKSLDGILRAAGLIAGFQTQWKMSETQHEGVKIVTYTFPEAGEPKFNDPDNLRFNAAPSFAFVKDSLIVGSTPGIVKSLIPLLRTETQDVPEVWKMKASAAGVADVLAAHPDATVTEAVLTQGITLAEARKQTLDLTRWVSTLGSAALVIEHGDNHYHFDAVWSFKK